MSKPRLLLDTHYVLEAVAEIRKPPEHMPVLEMACETGEVLVSVVSLWECFIKWRVGKLPLVNGVRYWPEILEKHGIEMIDLSPRHLMEDIGMEPGTKDPFDRLLLSTAVAENAHLVTRDQTLQLHPKSWTPFVV